MNNQMREEFETWARERGYNLKRDDVVSAYAYRHTDQCWNAWVASRKALVVYLPTLPYPELTGGMENYLMDAERRRALLDCRFAIQSAGIGSVMP